MDFPVLVFPAARKLQRDPGHPFPPSGHVPAVGRQVDRMKNRFDELRRIVEKCDAGMDVSEDMFAPDRVLVFEISGNLDEFTQAAVAAGFEWLGTMAAEMPATDDFYPTKYDKTTDQAMRVDGMVSTRLYATLPTLEGIRKLLSLWDKWQADDLEFDSGLAPFKKMFSHLIALRKWGVRERLLATLPDYLNEMIGADPDAMVTIEIEIWPFRDEERRIKAIREVSKLITDAGGKINSKCDLSEAGYHAILAEIPLVQAKELKEVDGIYLVNCDDVQFIGPSAQSLITFPTEEELKDSTSLLSEKANDLSAPSGKPIVALLDGLPLANHELLRGRIIIDDPDDLSRHYDPGSHFHGTTMASVVLHGDLNEPRNGNQRPLYSRPILVPKRDFKGRLYEEIPDGVLFPDLLHRSIKRLFDGQGLKDGHDIKLINLSVCDARRPYFQWPSPAARVIDWLSYEFNVVFIVSAGNFAQDIQLSFSRDDFEGLSSSDRHRLLLQHQREHRHENRILSPAESVNALTVGALNFDFDNDPGFTHPQKFIADNNPHLPAFYSTFGPGINASIKPDLMMPGGRCGLNLAATGHATTTLRWAPHKTGVLAASPGNEPGVLNAIGKSYGTSHAAARLSHEAEQAYALLKQLQEEYSEDLLPEKFLPVIMKALLAHSADLGDAEPMLAQNWQLNFSTHGGKEELARLLGYGRPDLGYTIMCHRLKATLIGFGEISGGEAHEFTIPVPDELSGKRYNRTLKYTVAGLSPINPRTYNYHAYRLEAEIVAPSPTNQSFGMGKVGTSGGHGWRLAEKGMLLSHTWVGDTGTKFPANSDLKVQVKCKSVQKNEGRPLRYGIVATFAVQETVGTTIPTSLSVYTRIADAIRAKVTPRP